MHFISEKRYNPQTQSDGWYYRIKKSYRDLTGRVRSRVMLNVGFINEEHRTGDIRDIGKCLTHLQVEKVHLPLDENRQGDEDTKSRHDRGRQRIGRKSPLEAM